MAGLLDFVNTPEGQGLLSAAFGGLAGARRGTPLNNLGRAGLSGLSGFVDANDRVTQQAALTKRNQLFDLQLQQAQQAQADMAARRKLAADSAMTPNQVAMNANGGPTIAAGMAVPTTAPGYNYKKLGAGLAALGDWEGALKIEQALKKDTTPIKLAAGETLVEPGTFKPVYSAPNKPAEQPSAVREYEYAKQQGYGGTFEQFQLAQKRAGATNIVTDNLGLKPKDRFEMEDKLRNDYTKATDSDTSVVSASQNISNLLKQGGALKDQGAIYSFAKLLDPLGAVREADYAAIVRTAGGLDYVTSLFNRALTGEQLSPKQRVEMDRVATSMANVAKQRISKQQKRFTGIAKMYNLQPENVFQTGEEAAMPDPLGLRGK